MSKVVPQVFLDVWLKSSFSEKIILLTVCQKLSLEFHVFIGRRHQANNWNWYWLYWIHRLWTSTRRQRIFNWGKIVKLFTGKVIYIAHYFIMLQLNPFDLNVDRRGMMAWALCVIVAGLIIKTLKHFLTMAISAPSMGLFDLREKGYLKNKNVRSCGSLDIYLNKVLC